CILSVPFLSFFFFYCFVHHRDLHSFPTRRSSDLFFIYTENDTEAFFDVQWQLVDVGVNYIVVRRFVADIGGTQTAILFCNQIVRSEEHTSELQSRENLVCRLLLEKKKNTESTYTT